MNAIFLTRPLALLALCAVAACGGSGISNAVPTVGGGHGPGSSPLLARIVGVGDSLTAGYQAGGFLGATGVRDPLEPSEQIPPGQENGFWAYLDEQASGLPLSTAIDRMYDPSVSPLPLIAGPGLNNQVVPAGSAPYFGFEKPGNPCRDDGGFNAAGYTLRGVKRVRMNAFSSTIRNVAVPGITLHEANTLTRPQSTSCEPLPGIQGLIAQVVDDESSTFWPVLSSWSNLGQQLTMVNAAVKAQPTLATVWLGANDVLKFMGSGGRFTGGDRTVGQVSADLRQTIKKMTGAGARVVVANLPNILETPYFMRVTVPGNLQKACFPPGVQTYLVCVWGNITTGGTDFSGAIKVANAVAAAYHLGTPNGCTPTSTSKPCGYLTLQGTFAALQYSQAHDNRLPDLDKGVPGSGLGTYYITPEFAAKVQRINDIVNEGIAGAVGETHSPLVDVRAFFSGVASGNAANPYYRQASTINPPYCCTLAFEGGLVSFDGLHPSNTGYAMLAYYFIKTINSAYGAKIPQIDVNAVYNGTRCGNPQYCFQDVYAPPFNGT